MQTELLPTSWSESRLGDIVAHQKGYAFDSSDFQESGRKVVRISNTTASSVDLEACVCVSKEVGVAFERYALRENDILMTTVGSRPHLVDSAVGKTIRITNKVAGALLNQNAVVFRPLKPDEADSLFLFYLLTARPFRFHIEKLVRGNANQVSITLEDIFAFRLAIPPLPEQQKIAAILSTWDRAIELTEKLIAAKQKRKQALMQQLLTGKVRFSNKADDATAWKQVPLGELTEKGRPICYGVIQPGEADVNGVRMIRGGDIFEGRISDSLRTISHTVSQQYKRTILRGGELLAGLVGYPGETALVPDELVGANVARQVAMIALRPEINREYVQQYLGSPIGKAVLLRPTIGSAQQVINIADVKKVKIPFPSSSEQKAIAAVLSAADREVERIRVRRDLLKVQKKGLMQQLLIGKVRVNVDAEMVKG